MSLYDIIYEYENLFIENPYVLPIGKVIQVSELSIVKNGEIVEHEQICDELTYIISGSAVVVSNNEQYEISEGELHFIKKGLTHKIIAKDKKPLRYICIGIELDKNYDGNKPFFETDFSGYFFSRDDGNIKIFSELLLNEFYSKNEASDIMINSLLTQIFITLVRIYKDQRISKGQKREYAYNDSKATLHEVLRYIDREYMNIKNVRQISQDLSYNNDYISHLFRKKMDMTLKEYLMRKKISHSTQLLLEGNLSIEQISEHLNFSSSHSFYQAFKRITTQSPSEYRKQNSKF